MSIDHRVELHTDHQDARKVRGILEDEENGDQYDEFHWSEDDRGEDVGIRFYAHYGDHEGSQEKASAMKDTLYPFGSVWLWY